MNVASKRNIAQEATFGVYRYYDIYNIEAGGLHQKKIGSVILNSYDDMNWRIDSPKAEPFGDFVQCIAELKIREEVAHG